MKKILSKILIFLKSHLNIEKIFFLNKLPKIRNKYDLVCSLGANCAMAGILKESNARTFSFPFDWLDGADLATRARLIANRFENFLNLEDFQELYIENDPQKDKRRYINKRTGLKFHHDWLINQTLEEGYLQVKKSMNDEYKDC